MSKSQITGQKVKAYLKRIVGKTPRVFYPILKSNITIGRSKQADIHIENQNISRNHFALKETDYGWLAIDLGGVNGTYINNNKLKPTEEVLMEFGSLISLGPPADAPIIFSFLKQFDGSELASSQNDSTSNRFPIEMQSTSSGLQGKKSKYGLLKTKQTNVEFDMLTASVNIPKNNRNCFDSDSSLSSLDSLKTRMRKYSSGKKRKRKKSVSSDDGTGPSCSHNSPKKRLFNEQNKGAIKQSEIDYNFDSIFFSDCSSSEVTLNADSESLLHDKVYMTDDDFHLSSSPHKENFLDSQNDSDKSEKSYHKKKKKKDNEDIERSNMIELQAENERLITLAGELSLKVADIEEKKKLMAKIMEDEVLCNICTEVFIKATTLGCSHTFCEYCINQWKKKKNQCPICREKIITQINVLVLDSVISKLTEFMDSEQLQRRENVIEARTQTQKVLPKKKGKKGRQARFQGHVGVGGLIAHYMV